ncbi:transcriptional regulator [Streptomyces inusitatus]|uniref:Transcriptional regulator n=1 Tax=Streptomyces inusitatus TaxID=68221 RepID=A0A918UPX8_9ACTN|nr:transcriptional regulator [Streptomyces inusitatus]
MNRALERAKRDAELSSRKLATRTGVTRETVERWIANEGRKPHTRTAVRVAEELGVTVEMLWPTSIRQAVKAGPDREIVAAYPFRSSCPNSVWTTLIDRAQHDLLFAGYTNYFLWTEQPQLSETLRRKALSGCRIRFLVGNPESSITRMREEVEDSSFPVSTRIRITLGNLQKLAGIPQIEARYCADSDAVNHVSLSVFRMDSEALVTPHLASVVGHDSPMLHLKRMDEKGLYDQFVSSAEELWGRGIPV